MKFPTIISIISSVFSISIFTGYVINSQVNSAVINKETPIELSELAEDNLKAYSYLYNQINSDYQKGGSDEKFCRDFTTLNEIYPETAAKHVTGVHLKLEKNCNKLMSNR